MSIIRILLLFLLITTISSSSSLDKYSYAQVSNKDYIGITLNILTHEIPVMGEPTVLHAKQFEKLTGIKINVHHVPFSKLYQEAIFGLKNNKYDIVFYGSLWIADIYKYLEPVPETLLQSKSFVDILPHYQSIAKWGRYNISG